MNSSLNNQEFDAAMIAGKSAPESQSMVAQSEDSPWTTKDESPQNDNTPPAEVSISQ